MNSFGDAWELVCSYCKTKIKQSRIFLPHNYGVIVNRFLKYGLRPVEIGA